MNTKVNSRNPKSNHNDATLPDLLEGTPVLFSNRLGKEFQGTFSHWTKLNEAYIKCPSEGNKPYWKKPDAFQVVGEAMSKEAGTISQAGETPVFFKPAKTFDINKRFSFLSSLVRMTIKKQSVSLIITGDGGLGKTKTVMTELEAAGLIGTEVEEYYGDDSDGEEKEDNSEFTVIKGYSTAKGLYNTLYHNRAKLIIFDDCDEILTNDTARNILKGALDSYDKRIVHWVSNAPSSDVPNSFEFKGQIIFISNMSRSKMSQALISRSTCIDVSMTTDEKITRMRSVLANVCPEVPMIMKEEAMEVMEQWKNETRDLNFRTLIKVINIRTAAVSEEWREMAEYMLLS